MPKKLKPLLLPILSLCCLALSALFLVLALNSRSSPSALAAEASAVADTSGSAGEASVPSGAEPPETAAPEGDRPQNVPLPEHLVLDVPVIPQHPELPNGCEITALAEVLAYFGVGADKLWLCENYFPRCEVGAGSPNEFFVGDPTSSALGTAFGCFAPVVTRAANAYLSDIGSPLRAVNLTGADVGELCGLVARGVPVIVWITKGMQPSRVAAVWELDGTEYSWLTLSHCAVLVGYTPSDLIFADPLDGLVSFFRADAEASYRQQQMQAVALLGE